MDAQTTVGPAEDAVEVNLFNATVDDLHLDGRNAITHTTKNKQLITKSLKEVGAGRSIVIDEHGKVLAGNGTLEAARAAGFKKVVVIDGDRDTIIAVRRTDLSELEKTRLALLDNRASDEHKWNQKVLKQIAEENPAQQILGDLFDERDLKRFYGAQEQAQPLAGGGVEDDPETANTEVLPADAPESAVQMVQLYLTKGTQPQFIGQIKALGKVFGTTTITSTLEAVVKVAHARYVTQGQPIDTVPQEG